MKMIVENFQKTQNEINAAKTEDFLISLCYTLTNFKYCSDVATEFEYFWLLRCRSSPSCNIPLIQAFSLHANKNMLTKKITLNLASWKVTTQNFRFWREYAIIMLTAFYIDGISSQCNSSLFLQFYVSLIFVLQKTSCDKVF